MKSRKLLGKKMPTAIAAAAGLLFGVTMTPLNAAQTTTSPASGNAISSHQSSRHLVLHGIHFDSRSGKLDDGSKAVLDEGAEFLKSNPKTIVFMGRNRGTESAKACDISADEARTVQSYMKERGVPAGQIVLCQGGGSFRVAQER